MARTYKKEIKLYVSCEECRNEQPCTEHEQKGCDGHPITCRCIYKEYIQLRKEKRSCRNFIRK